MNLYPYTRFLNWFLNNSINKKELYSQEQWQDQIAISLKYFTITSKLKTLYNWYSNQISNIWNLI